MVAIIIILLEKGLYLEFNEFWIPVLPLSNEVTLELSPKPSRHSRSIRSMGLIILAALCGATPKCDMRERCLQIQGRLTLGLCGSLRLSPGIGVWISSYVDLFPPANIWGATWWVDHPPITPKVTFVHRHFRQKVVMVAATLSQLVPGTRCDRPSSPCSG